MRKLEKSMMLKPDPSSAHTIIRRIRAAMTLILRNFYEENKSGTQSKNRGNEHGNKAGTVDLID